MSKQKNSKKVKPKPVLGTDVALEKKIKIKKLKPFLVPTMQPSVVIVSPASGATVNSTFIVLLRTGMPVLAGTPSIVCEVVDSATPTGTPIASVGATMITVGVADGSLTNLPTNWWSATFTAVSTGSRFLRAKLVSTDSMGNMHIMDVDMKPIIVVP
jgi:hypothetical protein